MKEKEFFIETILDSINKIEKYTRNIDFQDFLNNEEKIDACITQLLHIGEISRKLKEKFGDDKELPFNEMIGLRNIIAHNYLGISYNMIYSIIEIDLPKLKITLFNKLK